MFEKYKDWAISIQASKVIIFINIYYIEEGSETIEKTYSIYYMELSRVGLQANGNSKKVD